MEKQRFRCRHCRRIKVVRVLEQKYCGDKACQQARRNAWRREKYAEDSDYRRNQQASTESWLSSQGGAAAYYRQYRARRKVSTDDGLKVQGGSPPALSDGDQKVQGGSPPTSSRKCLAPGSVGSVSFSANRDASSEDLLLKSGRYTICPAGANRDAFLVEIRVVPDG